MAINLEKSISIIEPLSLGNENKMNLYKPKLNKLGKKKTVSFSTGVSIIDVEKWKHYNADVSKEGGCSTWDIRKNEERYKKKEEEERRKKTENGCVCLVF